MKASAYGLVAALALLVSAPALSGPASARDVNVTLVAAGFEWHVGTASAPADPTITIAPGDVLRLTIRDEDTQPHTFTSVHFGINDTLPASATIFVNITSSAADLGPWQFHCIPHSAGTDENRTGMIGVINVATSPPPRTPGLEAFAVVGAIAAAFVLVRSRRQA